VAGSLVSPQSSLRCRKYWGVPEPRHGRFWGKRSRDDDVKTLSAEDLKEAIDGAFVWMEIRLIRFWKRLGL
jgi:hypothetical protein